MYPYSFCGGGGRFTSVKVSPLQQRKTLPPTGPYGSVSLTCRWSGVVCGSRSRTRHRPVSTIWADQQQHTTRSNIPYFFIIYILNRMSKLKKCNFVTVESVYSIFQVPECWKYHRISFDDFTSVTEHIIKRNNLNWFNYFQSKGICKYYSKNELLFSYEFPQ